MCTAAKEGYHCTIAFVIQMNGIHRVFPNEATVGKEDLEEMGTAMTLDLLEDGTGTMDYDGTVYDLTWDDRCDRFLYAGGWCADAGKCRYRDGI